MSSNKAGSLKNISSRNISENKSEYRLKESLAPYVLQIIGMTFILPVVLASSALLQLKSEAITALLGAIIGYIFGSAGTSTSKDDRTSSPSDQQIGERAVQPPVHISWFWAGRPGANQTIGTHTFDTMTTLPTGLAGSHG